MLNTQQLQAVKDISSFLANYQGSGSTRCYALLGGAGTGKTFTTAKLLQLVPDIIEECIFMTPTHAAKKVLQGFLEENGFPDANVTTIHSGLGLSISDNEGKKTTKKKDTITASSFKYWFIDECSMVDTELMGHIIEKSIEFKSLVVLLGDKLQLPPVSRDNDKKFPFEYYLHGYSELTEVMRYSGVISEFVEKSKECVRDETLYNPVIQLLQNRTKSDCPRRIKKSEIIDCFIEGESQILALQNRTVQRFNFDIRAKVMGIPSHYDDFMLDEKVIANDVIKQNRDILFNNGAELDIIGCQKTKLFNPIKRAESYASYHLTLCDSDSEQIGDVNVVDRTDLKRYQADLSELMKMAANCNYQDKNAMWGHYYNFKSANAPIRHRYASTIHKSQGQSIKNPIICNDFGFMKDGFMQPRLWYVAMSRTKEHLTIAP